MNLWKKKNAYDFYQRNWKMLPLHYNHTILSQVYFFSVFRLLQYIRVSSSLH